jgi:hypothetical protein
MDLETLAKILGWCTVLHFAILAFKSLLISAARGFITKVHGKMFNLGERDLSRLYFQYLAIYKIVAIATSLVPYIAVRIAISSGSGS